MGITYLNDAYGQGLNVALSQQLNSVKTLHAAFYDRGGDLDASVASMDAFNPDLTVLIGFPDDVGRFITKAAVTANLSRAAGHRWFFTDSAKDPAIISGSPAGELESSYGTTPAQTSGPAYAAFQSDFQAHYGIDPSSYAFIAHTYDAVYVVALGCAFAVGSAGTDPLNGSRIGRADPPQLGHAHRGRPHRFHRRPQRQLRAAVGGPARRRRPARFRPRDRQSPRPDRAVAGGRRANQDGDGGPVASTAAEGARRLRRRPRARGAARGPGIRRSRG